MKLDDICELFNCAVVNKPENSERIDIESVGAADLMSDVLAFGAPGMLLITGLNSPQCVRTASVVGAVAVLVIRKRDIPETTMALAQELGIPLLHARTSMYKACGILFSKGLKDALEESKQFD